MQGITLDELARCGIEHILTVYSDPVESQTEWQPPKPRRLGWMGLSDAEIKAEIHKATGSHSNLR